MLARLIALFALLALIVAASAQDRIVGGTAAAANEFPFMAYVEVTTGMNMTGSCGGAIISEEWVVTAAHCFSTGNETTAVFTGALNHTQGDSTNVDMIRIHPNYNATSLENDIAVLHLATNLTWSASTGRIYFASVVPAVSTMLTAAGWGDTTENGTASEVLLKVDLPLLDNADCAQYEPDYDNSTNICAGNVTGQDTCQGDSGGPLFQAVSTHFEQIGVVSYGTGCARNPGVYVNIPGFGKAWVETETGVNTTFVASSNTTSSMNTTSSTNTTSSSNTTSSGNTTTTATTTTATTTTATTTTATTATATTTTAGTTTTATTTTAATTTTSGATTTTAATTTSSGATTTTAANTTTTAATTAANTTTTAATTASNATTTAATTATTASNTTTTVVDTIADCTFIATTCPEKLTYICVAFTCPSNAAFIYLQYKEVSETIYDEIELAGNSVGYTIGFEEDEEVLAGTSYNIQVYAETALGTVNTPLALSSVYTTAAEGTNPSLGEEGCKADSLTVTEDLTLEQPETTAKWKYHDSVPDLVKIVLKCGCPVGSACRQPFAANPSNIKKRIEKMDTAAEIKKKSFTWKVNREGAKCRVTVRTKFQRANKLAKGATCKTRFTSSY